MEKGKSGNEAVLITEKETPPTPQEIAVSELSVNIEPEIIFVEKPVYVPEKDWKEEKQEDPVEFARKVTEAGIKAPNDYNRAAFLYDYNTDQVYEIYAQVLRTTDITLEAGEIALDAPFISDSDNWIIAAGVSREDGRNIQHIYLKPKQAGLEASFIINTDRRVYHLLLKSFNTTFMPVVKWRYKMKETFTVTGGTKGQYLLDDPEQKNVTLSEEIEYVDPRYLSFDYKVRYNIFKKPRWLPRMVYDDGQKTYIVFNSIVLQTEMPEVVENYRDIVNYRVAGDIIIIDKLIEKAAVAYNGDKITIEKKK
jgi:type IV secretion system protein VirB9